MKLIQRRSLVAGLAFASLCLLGLAPAQAQEGKRARLGHSFADSHPRAIAMKQFAADVAKATDGKVPIAVTLAPAKRTVYTGGVFVGTPDAADPALQAQGVVIGVAPMLAVDDRIGDQVAHRGAPMTC